MVDNKEKLSKGARTNKNAEEALRRSEERYKLAQRAANIGSWDWDILTGDLHWSETIEPMFGFSKGKFGATYEAFLNSVHPEDRQFVQDSVDACVEDGKEYAIEHRIVWPDGTLRWVSETGDVFRDENGKAIRMLGIVKDITLNKVAEERVRYLSSLLFSIKEIGHIIGRESELSSMMQKACDKLIETRDYLDISISLLDDKSGKIVPIAQAGKHKLSNWEIGLDGEGEAPECIKAVLKSGSNQRRKSSDEYCTTCEFYKQEDEHQTILIPMKYHDSIVGIMSMCSELGYEIDEEEVHLLEELAEELSFARAKIKAEEDLQMSEEIYRTTFNTSPDLFYRVSPEGKILDVNDKAINTLGYSRDELIGIPLFNLYAEESRAYAKECFDEWLKTGKLRNKELKIQAKDGKKIDIALSVNTIYDSKGNVVSSISSQRIGSKSE
jgi:PAS domain S-box-containing protein